ncbi:MAG TPA: hypothetical protein VEI97_17695, partial [bacterium]|nr:hypothetical protein [bacterium]
MRYLYFTFLAALWAFNPSRVTAQCTFTSTLAGGDWSSPTTWIRTGTGCGTSLIPTPTSAVVINGPVTLDQNVTLNGSTGSLTINSTGSLVEDDSPRTLILGQTTGGNVANRFVLSNGGTFNVSTFEITKSTGTLNGRGTIKCNLYLGNQSSLTINNELVILGNLQLDPGNPALAGTGSVRVVGCVVGSNGALNGVVIAPLRVCVQNLPTSCGTGACNGDVPINNDANCTFLLPVELSAFSAAYEAARRSVQLRWQTASEK